MEIPKYLSDLHCNFLENNSSLNIKLLINNKSLVAQLSWHKASCFSWSSFQWNLSILIFLSRFYFSIQFPVFKDHLKHRTGMGPSILHFRRSFITIFDLIGILTSRSWLKVYKPRTAYFAKTFDGYLRHGKR